MSKWNSLEEAYSIVYKKLIKLDNNISYIEMREALDFCADNHHVDAQYLKYAVEYQEAKRNGTHLSLEMLEEASKAGHSAAQYDLALHYLYGEYVDKDINNAIRWMESSAEQGYREACRTLVRLYTVGSKVDRDLSRAEFWRSKYEGNSPCVHKDITVSENDLLRDKEVTKLESNIETTATVKENNKKIIDTPTVSLVSEKKSLYENNIKQRIEKLYQLTEIEEIIRNLSSNEYLNVVLANDAELAYVSGELLQAKIGHDIEVYGGNEKVCLWKAQTKNVKFPAGIVMISNAFINQGCLIDTVGVWDELENVPKLNAIEMNESGFFYFTGKDEKKRWGYRKLKSATHLVIQKEDIRLFSNIEEDYYVSLMKDNKSYIILSKKSAEQLGVTTENLWYALENLKKAGDISELPRLISGLVFAKTNEGFEIKGIGLMKFDEY